MHTVHKPCRYDPVTASSPIGQQHGSPLSASGTGTSSGIGADNEATLPSSLQEKIPAYMPMEGSAANGKVWPSWLRVPYVSCGERKYYLALFFGEQVVGCTRQQAFSANSHISHTVFA